MRAEDSLPESLYIGKVRVVEDVFVSESDPYGHAYMEVEDMKDDGLCLFIVQLADSEKTEDDDEWDDDIYVLPWEEE